MTPPNDETSGQDTPERGPAEPRREPDWNAPLVPRRGAPRPADDLRAPAGPPAEPVPPRPPAPEAGPASSAMAPPGEDDQDVDPVLEYSRRHRRKRGRDTDDDGLRVPGRTKLIIFGVLALVAVAVAGVLIASATRDDDDSSSTVTAGSGAPEYVGIFGSTESFERPDNRTDLGEFVGQRPWQVDAGTWGIDDNSAYVSEPGDARNFAVVGLGRGDGGAQVRMPQVVAGSGLAFRYRGPFNYWAVVAVPDFATWNVVKVVDGKQEVVDNTGPESPVRNGTTIAVRLAGETIDVIVDGRVRVRIQDDTFSDAGKVGMTTPKGDDGMLARFDDFVASLPGNRPLPAPPSTQRTTSTTATTLGFPSVEETTTTEAP